MTDKEKIRAEIEKSYNEAQNRVKIVKDEYWEGKVDAYRNVLCIFDSIQEEPTGNPLGSTHADFRTAVESLGISQEEHDRIVDECIYGKEPELVDADYLPKEEPVSEDLEEEIKQYLNKEVIVTNEDVVISKHHEFHNFYVENLEEVAHHFANWQKKQLMANAAEVTVHIEAGNYPYIPQLELYDYDKDMPLAKEGEKYKVVLIKED